MRSKYTSLAILFSFSALICSCAKPNYQSPPTAPSREDNKPAQGDDSSRTDCKLFFTISNLCAQIEWEKRPTDSQAGSFFLSFTDHSDSPTDPQGTPWVVLWMPSMGHGSVPVKIQQVSKGLYRVYNVFFIMPGDWDIRLQIKSGDQVVEQIAQQIQI